MLIVYLVLASDNHINEADLRMQKSTWAEKDTAQSMIVWVRGSSQKIESINNRELCLGIPESAENILEKSRLAIAWAAENFSPDFIVRTNVSTYFDLAQMEKMLSKEIDSKIDFFGFPEYTGKEIKFIDKGFCFFSGTGLLFSKTGYGKLLQLDPLEYKGIPDDVAISHFMSSRNAKRKMIHRGNLGYTRFFIPYKFMRLKSSENSDLTVLRYKLVHKYFQKNSFIGFLSVQLAELKNLERDVEQLSNILKMMFVCSKRWLQIEFDRLLQ